MKQILTLLKTPKYISLLIVVIASVFAGWYLLLPGFFNMHDDMQVIRIEQMEQCFNDGQIPCRWVPDLGAGKGYPLFNFYSPLPYYVGVLMRWIGVTYLVAVKGLFFIGLIGSGIGMWWLAGLLTKNWWSAAVAGVLYIFAPYHSVDIFVRGALAESWALLWFPVILGTIWKWAEEKQHRWSPAIAFSITGLYLSHNIMSLWFSPVFAGWGLLVLWYHGNFSIRKIILFVGHIIWAMGLGAFFLIPVAAEKGLVQTQHLTSEYYNFRLHFATWRQLLLDRSWGFGPSIAGPEDGVSFQIGWPHWWLVLVAGVAISWRIWQEKKLHTYLPQLFVIASFICTLFMLHARSVLVWEAFPIFSWTQFPWRILALAIFFASLIGGWLVNLLPAKRQWPAAGLIVLSGILLNWNYFVPEKYYPLTRDEMKLSGEEWERQQKGAILDYLPKTVPTLEVTQIPSVPVHIMSPENQVAESAQWQLRSNFFGFDVHINGDEPVTVVVEQFMFPGWKVLDGSQPIPISVDPTMGLISFTLQGNGKHIINGWFTNTPIRNLANMITVASYGFLIWLWVHPSKVQKKVNK